MPEYSDIYVISNKRDADTVANFLDHFLPEREECADEYEIPQYSGSPHTILSVADELVKYCSENKKMEHSVYWRAINNNKPECGMVFYLKDGNTIYGLSTDASNPLYSNQLLHELQELQEFIGSTLGCIGHEAPPDMEGINGFKNMIQKHKL